MNEMNKTGGRDFFSEKASSYDSEKSRVQNVMTIGEVILQELSYTKRMHIMDFGSGTGLLLSQVAPYVGEITAVDVSSSMNAMLRSKLEQIDCQVNLLEIDLTEDHSLEKFDSIISSMTIHHIENPQAIFNTFYDLLKEEGTIAIADLDSEDGSFHSEDTGVHHFGFDREQFLSYAEEAGFKDLKIQTVSIIKKPQGDFSVFLLTGRR